jgi:hypothetical protein
MRQSCCSWIALVLALSSIARAGIVSVAPVEDEKAVLHNPDMGWVLYENYPVDPAPNSSSTLVTLPNESFDGVDEVAVMFTWYDVEKSEGKYDFADVDRAYDYWAKRGKRLQLRMSSETLLWWDNANPPRGKGPPDWVLERMPAERKQRRDNPGLPPYTVVDARDSFYLERLSKFLDAVAKHFRPGKGRPVTLVDLRGFGVWGEWHSGFRFANVEDRRAALIGVIDRYAAAFPDHWLSMSYSYDPDGPKELYAGPVNRYDEAFTKSYEQYLSYSAFDHALTKTNVTFRRDGAGGAVHSNERKLCEAAFATLKKGPFMSEFMDGYATSKKGDKGWVPWKVEDALSLHPNYVNLLGYQGQDALDFLTERKDLIDHGLRTMGYRLVPTKLTFPSEISSGKAFDLSGEWVNRAVGRAMQKFTLRVSLLGTDGKIVATADAGKLPTDEWIKGKTYTTTSPATFASVSPGTYSLAISLIDPRDGKTVAMPLKDSASEGVYRIGETKVVAP